MPILREQLCSCLGKLLESQLDVFGFGEGCCYLVHAAVGSVKCRSPRDSTKGNAKLGVALSLKDLSGSHQGFGALFEISVTW